MHPTTEKILEILKDNLISIDEKLAIDREIVEATSQAFTEGREDYANPCGCGQPSCSFCG